MATNDRKTRRITLANGGTIDMTTLSPEAARQAETDRQLQQAGISLTPEQAAQLRQAVSEAIVNTLTAEQRLLWERYLHEQAAQFERDAVSEEISIGRDRTDEARQWEALKQRLREAGVPLTLEQEAQMQQIHEQMGNELEQAFRANPFQELGKLFGLFFLPRVWAERMAASSAVDSSLQTYIQSINTILTPEQQQVWQHHWSDRSDQDA
jgi:hypothetical protein